MANFLYNGVELPALPSYDKSVYPYALINSFTGEYLDSFLTANGYGALVGVVDVLYSLRVISKPYHNYPDTGWTVSGSISLKRYVFGYNAGLSEWMFVSDYSATGLTGIPDGEIANGQILWVNYDAMNMAYNADGDAEAQSVYLAASAPLRVDSKLRISVGGGANGDGYALYNGVKLPDIDSVWTDKEAYPSAQLYKHSAPETYALILNGLGCGYGEDGYYYINGTKTTAYIVTFSESMASNTGFPLGEWSFWLEEASATVRPAEMGLSILWSNQNILDGDSTVFAASDPISLDGYTVIEWDGDRTGLEGSNNLYLLSNSYEDASTAVAVLKRDAIEVCTTFTSGDGTWYVQASNNLVVAWGVPDAGIGGYYVGSDDEPNYTSLIAYKAASSDAITSTTATVSFTCTNLENTEATDCIKAWVYKKSDGLSIAVEPTWTSELFGAPSYSASHTFTGLSPNTEYEVYGCIFVDGEATDHNALAAFTTLEASGDLKPVYKRVNGAWVKQTAYERVNGEWVLISTRQSGGSGMYSYNGVELPDINTVWTDKEAYPYAVMTAFDASVYDMTGYLYSLNLLTAESYMDSNKLMLPAGGRGTVYWLATDEGLAGDLGISVVNEWSLGDDEFGSDDAAIQCNIYEEPPVWSNYDILNADGTTYLAASDPVPV